MIENARKQSGSLAKVGDQFPTAPRGASSSSAVIWMAYYAAVDIRLGFPLPSVDVGFRPPFSPGGLKATSGEETEVWAAYYRVYARYGTAYADSLLPQVRKSLPQCGCVSKENPRVFQGKNQLPVYGSVVAEFDVRRETGLGFCYAELARQKCRAEVSELGPFPELKSVLSLPAVLFGDELRSNCIEYVSDSLCHVVPAKEGVWSAHMVLRAVARSHSKWKPCSLGAALMVSGVQPGDTDLLEPPSVETRIGGTVRSLLGRVGLIQPRDRDDVPVGSVRLVGSKVAQHKCAISFSTPWVCPKRSCGFQSKCCGCSAGHIAGRNCLVQDDGRPAGLSAPVYLVGNRVGQHVCGVAFTTPWVCPMPTCDYTTWCYACGTGHIARRQGGACEGARDPLENLRRPGPFKSPGVGEDGYPAPGPFIRKDRRAGTVGHPWTCPASQCGYTSESLDYARVHARDKHPDGYRRWGEPRGDALLDWDPDFYWRCFQCGLTADFPAASLQHVCAQRTWCYKCGRDHSGSSTSCW